MGKRAETLILGALLVVSLLLRLYDPGMKPLGDEEITAELVRSHGVSELLRRVPVVQPHFPLYYVLLKIWPLEPLETARGLSIAAGAGVPGATFWWFKEMVEARRAAAASALLAASPVLVVQASWLRMYSLLALAVTLSWWTAWRRAESEGGSLAYVASAVPAAALHPFGAVAVVCQVIWLVTETRGDRRWGDAAAWSTPLSICAAGLGWMLLRVSGASPSGSISGEAMHTAYSGSPVLKAVILPVSSLVGGSAWPAGTLSALAITLVIATSLARSRPDHLALIVSWTAAPLALLYIGHAVRPIVMLKYMGWMAPGAALAVVSLSRERIEHVYGIMALEFINLAAASGSFALSVTVALGQGASATI